MKSYVVITRHERLACIRSTARNIRDMALIDEDLV